MATVAESLFGVTPESLQRQRQQQLRQEAMDFASISDPFQQANFAIYQGAGNLARGVGGLLGAQDPELMRVRQRQELLQGVDIADPAALRQAATVALQNGDNAAAQELARRALDIEKSKASIAKDVAAASASTATAAAGRLTTEQRNAAAIADTAVPNREDPKWAEEYNAQLMRLTAKERKTQVVGVAEGTKAPVYEDDQGQFTYVKGPDGKQTRQPYYGAVDRTTAKVSATAVTKGQEAFSEKMGELDAKRVSDALSARDNAFSTVRSLNQLANLDDQGLISGSFATGRVGVTNLLNTLGLASPADQARLASSQNYQKVAGDVILGVLGGKLGAGFSNEDRKFIEGLVPQLETSPMARRQLINFMTRKNMDIAEEATRLETYARDKNGLKGFTPKIPLGANIPATSMSADDLAKAAGGKIVNGKFVPNK
jgi:hypothetical protein